MEVSPLKTNVDPKYVLLTLFSFFGGKAIRSCVSGGKKEVRDPINQGVVVSAVQEREIQRKTDREA